MTKTAARGRQQLHHVAWLRGIHNEPAVCLDVTGIWLMGIGVEEGSCKAHRVIGDEYNLSSAAIMS